MSFQALDSVLVQQSLISGVVSDALTDEGLAVTPNLVLHWRINPAADYVQSSHVPTRQAGGLYAFSGAPERFFPTLAEGETLNCRLSTSADGYQPTATEFQLSREQVTPLIETDEYSSFTVQLPRLQTPVVQLNIALTPRAVSLAGRVIEDNDMASPIAAANVTITDPAAAGATTTDGSGYFRLDDLPIVKKITVAVEHDGDTTTQDILLDYGRRINERIFSLSA